MFKLSSTIYLLFFFIVVVQSRNAYIIDQRFVCIVKTSCLDCLKLSQCSWCPEENRCFSKELQMPQDYCANNTIVHVDYGLSIKENAECSCSKEEVTQSCYPPGVTDADGPECSGRGNCVCGQCVCDPNPDPEQPTKMVMGEYCEYDNFSCDDPKCNEGPYSLSHPTGEDSVPKTIEVEIPAS